MTAPDPEPGGFQAFLLRPVHLPLFIWLMVDVALALGVVEFFTRIIEPQLSALAGYLLFMIYHTRPTYLDDASRPARLLVRLHGQGTSLVLTIFSLPVAAWIAVVTVTKLAPL